MGNDLTLRSWLDSDCRLLYEWRLAATIRQWCIDQREFTYAEHQKWFAAFLADQRCCGFILEDKREVVAQIRFTPTSMPGTHRISLSAAPDKAKQGYGSSILRRACQEPKVRQLASLLLAETLVENLPSQKLFARNGFIQAGSGSAGGTELLCWLLPLAVPATPLPIQFFADPLWLEQIEPILSLTGMAAATDASAPIKIFIGNATSDEFNDSHCLLHLNTEAGAILDLALGLPGKLELPIEFYNLPTAIAQIAAYLLHLPNSG